MENVDIDDITEKGVSVFKAKDGIPQVDNIDQAISLVVRLDGRDMYEVKGKIVGKGQDGEPVLQNIKSQKISYDKEKIVDNVSGKRDNSASDTIYKFFDDKTNEDYYVYKGLEFRKPKNKNWKR